MIFSGSSPTHFGPAPFSCPKESDYTSDVAAFVSTFPSSLLPLETY